MADFSAVRQEDCREAKLQLTNGCALGSSRTVVLQSVLNEIKEHGRSSMHAEVCGVLIGSLCWDNGPYLLIDGRIEGKYASHQSGSVTFTSGTWDFIHEELAAKYPERIIVGWYHTHPGFGIFLSNMDAFIHENFFSFPWEPAYVFDPQAETDGFFFKIGTELVREEVCVIADTEPSVKEPPAGFVNLDKIVIENAHGRKRRHMLFGAIAAVLVCCVSAVVVFSMNRYGESGTASVVPEPKTGPLRILVENDWPFDTRLCDSFYVCPEQICCIPELHSILFMRDLISMKTDLEVLREQKRQLELHIKRLEEAILRIEKIGEPASYGVLSSKETTKPESTDKKERPWYYRAYYRMKFW